MIQLGTSDIASFAMGSIATIPSGGTYTWSSYVYATSVGSKVKGQVTVYVNGVRHWLTNSNAWVTSTVECNHLFKPTIANQWHKVDNQFTLPTGTLTNLSLGGWYRAASNFTIKIANCHLELNSHVTPFTLVSRTNTDSLIDLKKSTNIDLSNVSFDSTGQPTFDGTDDSIYPNIVSNSSGLTAITVEFIVKANANNKNLLNSSPGAALLHYGGAGFYLVSTDGTASGYLGWNGKLTGGGTGAYEHLVATYDGTTMRLYVNGESTGTTRAYSAGSTGILKDLNGVRIGGNFNSSQPWFNGDIPVAKIYNQALTAEEITQNFNAYKNRFNI